LFGHEKDFGNSIGTRWFEASHLSFLKEVQHQRIILVLSLSSMSKVVLSTSNILINTTKSYKEHRKTMLACPRTKRNRVRGNGGQRKKFVR